MKLRHEIKMDVLNNKKKDIYTFTKTKKYSPDGVISVNIMKKVFDFAYGMSFGKEGHHRNHRTGGIKHRKNGEIFADVFQGKLAEFALWEFFRENGLEMGIPDMNMYDKGVWDTTDFQYKKYKISVKSTKSYSQLILLESKDWTDKGEYIPNIENGEDHYDFIILIRLSTIITSIMMKNRIYFNDTVNKDYLREIVMKQKISFDVPGYINKSDLIQFIKKDYFISQGAYLNRISKKNKMDADNYYVQTGDLRNINDLISKLC